MGMPLLGTVVLSFALGVLVGLGVSRLLAFYRRGPVDRETPAADVVAPDGPVPSFTVVADAIPEPVPDERRVVCVLTNEDETHTHSVRSMLIADRPQELCRPHGRSREVYRAVRESSPGRWIYRWHRREG